MTCQEVIKAAEDRAFSAMQQAEARYKVAVREARQRRTAWREAKAGWYAIHELRETVKKAVESDASHHIDSLTEMRLSELIAMWLAKSPTGGGTVQQISEGLEAKRQTVSATLYNMKRRGVIQHDEATGIYCLTGPMAPIRSRPPQPK